MHFLDDYFVAAAAAAAPAAAASVYIPPLATDVLAAHHDHSHYFAHVGMLVPCHDQYLSMDDDYY